MLYWSDVENQEFEAEEFTGEIVNDAIYSRNLTVTERFNCKMDATFTDNFDATGINTITAGDDAYDIMFWQIVQIPKYATTGYFRDWYEDLPHVHLDKPWYIGNAAEALSVKGHAYAMIGEYDLDVLRLIDAFQERGLFVGSVCVTMYTAAPEVEAFEHKLNSVGVRTFRHYKIPGYPNDVARIVSDEGYGKNDYIETQRPLVVITAPGPGSGKMATCLSQLYHEYKRGVKAGYAKFETFPIWNLPLKHPVNLAYEAATADLDDVNMIDPFHLQAYGETTVNYNRDVEIFPVLKTMFERIAGSSPIAQIGRASCRERV